jgi:hypothetical protein
VIKETPAALFLPDCSRNLLIPEQSGKNSAAGVSEKLRERERKGGMEREKKERKRERKRGRTSAAFVSDTNRKELLRSGLVNDIVPPHRQHWVADRLHLLPYCR